MFVDVTTTGDHTTTTANQMWVATSVHRAPSHSAGNGSAASIGGSPFIGSGAARYNDLDGGFPLFFGMIAERDAKSFTSRGMVINDLDIDQDRKKIERLVH